VQIEELATGDFIRRCNNLIIVGWSGIGKSHIIQALGQKVCVQGYRVLYRTSAELLADLTASLADKTLPARLRYYTERVCCGIELDPKYIDVVIQRWQTLSGRKATLDGDGRTFEEIAEERRNVPA
jgi:hypothetical protein